MKPFVSVVGELAKTITRSFGYLVERIAEHWVPEVLWQKPVPTPSTAGLE